MPENEERGSCGENIMSEDYGDFIVEYYFPEDIQAEPSSYCSQAVNNRYASFYVPKREWEPLSYSRIPYSMIPKLYALEDTTSMTASGIIQVRQSALGLTGQGVLIGLIDTGIDYQNPVFRRPDGSTRIEAIWDQTLQDGPAPRWMSYGSEYRREQINEALRSQDPLAVVPSQDESGHGTFMAGVAAGGEMPADVFTGAAPQASIAMVKLKPAKRYLRDFYGIREDARAYQENDIMLAASYLRRLREELKVPLVILCCLGTNWGSHTGGSPLSQTLEMLVEQPGISVVVPTGNETGLSHHYRGQIQKEGDYADVEIRVAPGERGFQLELWAQIPDRFAVSITSPGGDQVPQIPLQLRQSQVVNFVLESSAVDVSYRILDVRSNSQLIVLRFLTPVPGVWNVRVYCVNLLTGVFHMWLPVRGFAQDDTVFLDPDPDTTLTVPSATAGLLAVGAYNHNTGGIYIRSGRGYTRLQEVKPDLAAPGVDIYGPGISGRYTRRTGTCPAAAHAAGAAACLLEWGIVRGGNVLMNNSAIRTLLIQGAGRNPNLSYPNKEWGYGTLDLYGAFASLR